MNNSIKCEEKRREPSNFWGRWWARNAGWNKDLVAANGNIFHLLFERNCRHIRQSWRLNVNPSRELAMSWSVCDEVENQHQNLIFQLSTAVVDLRYDFWIVGTCYVESLWNAVVASASVRQCNNGGGRHYCAKSIAETSSLIEGSIGLLLSIRSCYREC